MESPKSAGQENETRGPCSPQCSPQRSPQRSPQCSPQECSVWSSPGPRFDSPEKDVKLAMTPQRWSQAKARTARAAMRTSRARPTPREGRGDVSLCVRLKPGYEEEVVVVEGETVLLKPQERGILSFLEGKSREDGECSVCCDHAFGVQTAQEEVFDTAVAPIVDAVSRGYNGAVIAYGQTGSGKTYTMIGSKAGPGRGVAPRAVAGVFAGIRKATWRIEVSVLEVYNEKVRDLLAPGSTITTVEVHEVRECPGGPLSFRCPDATTWLARSPEEAMAALSEGCRRREVARTDMNHHSSRSHLVFTMNVMQCDREAGATLRSRLHLVDLAGSERLKRSMDSPRRAPQQGTPVRSPRTCQRREAGEINKSLSQLALVIQRLTSPGSQYVPYRDSVLTRLLAESFGSSKTCLLVCCSPGAEDREETKSSLEFGRRAKMVRNKATINLEVDSEPSAVMKALVDKELQEVQLDRDALIAARETLRAELTHLREEAANSKRKEEATSLHCVQLEEQLREAQRIATEATDAFSQLREARDDLEMRYFEEVDEQRQLLQGSTQRVAAFLEQAQMERSSLEVAAEALKEAHSKAASKLEEQMLLARSELQKEMSTVEAQKASAIHQQSRGEIAQLSRQLLELREDLVKVQEEKAQLAKRAQEDRSVLLGHWHEEVMRLREEKATALNALQTEKLSLRRRSQQEFNDLQRSKEEAIEDLEREKANLRQKWQAAMEETGVLQAQAVAAEERFQEQLCAHTSALEEEKAVLRRECHEEIGRLLDEKAAEEARHAAERLALQRRLDQAAAAMDQEKAGLLARLEGEKAALQSQLQEVQKERLRLVDEKAALAEGHTADLAKAQEQWGCALARELQATREVQRTEASRLQSLVQSLSEKYQASEWQTSLLQAELAVLQEHLRRKEPKGDPCPSPLKERNTGDATETEPEGEAKCQASFGKLRTPTMWSPSLKDLNVTDEDTWSEQ